MPGASGKPLLDFLSPYAIIVPMEKLDPLDSLRKLQTKTPWWSRLLGNFRAWKQARKARKDAPNEKYYVCTVWSWHTLYDNVYGGCFYILYEDGAGKRSYEFGREHFDVLEKVTAQATYQYAHAIRPWMLGRYTNEGMKQYADGQKTRPNAKT